MEFLLNWLLRGVYIVIGVGAALWIAGWLREKWRGTPERWMARIAVGMLVLAGVYLLAHARLLAQRESIEAARERYAVYGDPRRTEQRRGGVRGWILDCSGAEDRAFASYARADGEIARRYPIGEGGANFVGGGAGAEERDYTIELLFADRLREPRSFLELGELHPAGTDLRLTLCREITSIAYRQLEQTGLPGAVVVQDVGTGAVIAYASTGGPGDPPLGIKQYFPPGSVFKLALTALWWESGLPDDIPIPCPAEIQVTPRATISNAGNVAYGTVQGPTGMLIPSCNTAAVWMALRMREEIGARPFVEAYTRFGFTAYAERPPTDTIGDFWRTDSDRWIRRMTPAPSRIRISEETGDAEWAQLAIGQGPVDVTVVGVSRFLQAIANRGVMLPPSFEYELAADPPRGERVMSEPTAERLMRAMRLVVEQGTGRAAQGLIAGTGWDMGGKTGTAQVPGQRDNGWFAGVLFTPEGEPRYTIV
ncbi:MAG TPA: penicillin-binding transpeptidase domain-containing protein, partial [Longimicrobiaceae bacterium]|nr:penicillin-binding transpeptidase domain-containing protein [Longimicrobiaceae bacterium]